MVEIIHKYPEIETDATKPRALANLSFPYNLISSDRRFEELLYSLVKTQLGHGEFASYDRVSLMSGVAEKGRDCALFKNGNANGVIQCKKSDKNLSKEAFGKEITKFVLYSLQDNSILHNPETFNYYIAVSKGFTLECSDFIDSFNMLILSESKLSQWITFNINKFINLQHLKVTESNALLKQVKDILVKITVKKINYTDLDLYLANEKCKHLTSLFFEIKTVTDNSKIDSAKDEIIDTIKSLSVDNISIDKELNTGSISLKSEKNEFSDIPDSHIEREETENLFQWINSDITRNQENKALNFCLLAGNAGMGKTVILKDLYDKFTNTEVAVLALKADKLASTSILELQHKIGLSIPVFDFIEKCKQHYKTTVIIIDQIDALSQSMSSDKSYLQVFKNLVEQYLYDENVRIVVSTRIFDLHYDPQLQVYKNVHTVMVQALSEDKLLAQLSKLSIYKSMLSTKLLELLKIPNHLNVFSKIYKSNQSVLGISTLQEMYHELWRQKITNLSTSGPADRKKTKKLLYKISEKMFKDQQITVSELAYEKYSQELIYLQSEQLLKNEDRKLQFFHQSFYDFVFAKRFVERKNDLFKYIKDNGQTLLLRSAVKMILNYLREYNPNLYLETVEKIFCDKDILYHIKHMTLSSLLFYENPILQEEDIVKVAISDSFHLCNLFFEKARSEHWFLFSISNSLLEILKTEDVTITNTQNIDAAEFVTIRTAASNFLRDAAHQSFPGSWDFLLKLPDQSHMRYVLRTTKNWDNPLTYVSFETCNNFKIIDPYGYYRTINNIAEVNAEYALGLAPENLSDNTSTPAGNRIFGAVDFFKTLASRAPIEFLPLLLENLKEELTGTIAVKPTSRSYALTQISFSDSRAIEGDNYKYVLLAFCLQKAAKENAQSFQDFLAEHIHSSISIVLRLIIYALKSNEKNYATEIFHILSHILAKKDLYHRATLAIEARIIFEKAFRFFSKQQRQEIIKRITMLDLKHEISIEKKDGGKKVISSWWGLSKYCWLKRLPQDVIEHDQVLHKLNLELTRKFPNYVDSEMRSHAVSGAVHPPLPEKAYQHMNSDQWLESFKKYNGTTGHFDRPFLKGDIEEHANAFKEVVKNDPSPMKLSIIQESLNHKEINLRYPIYGLWGWSESNADPSEITTIFLHVLDRDLTEQLERICSYITENLVTKEKEDKRIIDLLLSSALEFNQTEEEVEDEEVEQETSIDNLITKGINTKYGSAASKLVRINDLYFKDQIFNTLEHILEAGPAHCRAAILYQFAYLMNVDAERAFKIFKDSVINEKDIHVLSSSIWSLQFMGNYDFPPLLPAYEKLVSASVLGPNESNLLFQILHCAFLFDKENAEKLICKLIESNNHVRSFGVNIVLQDYYTVPGSKEKNDLLLNMLLNKMTVDDFDNYGANFSNSLNVKLPDIKSFILKYTTSPYFRINDSFVEYLSTQCRQHVEDAIEIFNIALNSNKYTDDDMDHVYTRESGTTFILNAFNGLTQKDKKSKEARWNLMLAFDNVLKDHRFREDTDRIFEELM